MMWRGHVYKGQLVESVLNLDLGFQGLNSGRQACATSTFLCRDISPAITFVLQAYLLYKTVGFVMGFHARIIMYFTQIYHFP